MKGCETAVPEAKFNVGVEDAEEQFIAMIAVDNPVELFNAYREKLLRMGLDEVIDEVNQVIKDQGIK